MSGNPLPELPAGAFTKQDMGDDLLFYAPARLVTHIDEGAVEALTSFYRTLLPAGGRVLDLMSSWVSHLPAEWRYAEVVGHGLNAEELAANPRLDRWFVADLNGAPTLPLADAAFDAALCGVGVQYLQHPVKVFREVRRVLVAGAPLVVSFSNRCFPSKAVAIWRALDPNGQAALVRLYLERAGFTDVAAELLADGRAGEPLVAVVGRRYMRDADVLILHEPTAALDARAEYEVFQRFRELSAVLISHRFSSVRMADRILVLGHRRVEASGTHAELLAAGGRYAELFELQAAGYR